VAGDELHALRGQAIGDFHRLDGIALVIADDQLELAVDLFQLLAARLDVKDTPSGHPDAPACP